MEKIKIGNQFKNSENEIHVIIKISKTGLILTCKNIKTNEIVKYRFYEASCKYYKKNSNICLGDLI